MRIGVLGNEGSWYCEEIARAAEQRGHQCVRLEFRHISATSGSSGKLPDRPQSAAVGDVICDEYSMLDFDCVIVRTMPPGSLEQVVFRMNSLARLERAGVVVVNSPKSIECAVDKYLTTACLEDAGLPVPATITCQDSETAMLAFERLGGDVVVKPVFGAEGRGICRVSDPDVAFRVFRTLERIDAVLYLQRFVPHPGFDIRVMVIDGSIVGSMKRHGAENDFRTNVARSARAEVHSPTDQECEFAVRAAQAIGARFVGVDILYDDSGNPFVIEVNAVPGWRAFARCTGIDVAARLIKRLEHGAAD